MGLIDLHSHLLPGLDDGAVTITDSVAIVRAALVAGVDTIAATPHVRSDYPTTVMQMERALAKLRDELASVNVPIRLVCGAELALDFAERLTDADLCRLSLGGSGTLLLEMPHHGWPLDLDARLFRLRARGFRTLIAHPERNAEVVTSPGRIVSLVDQGAMVQLTAASLTGRFGKRIERTAWRLLEIEAAHVVASDVHRAGSRATLGEAAGVIRDGALAQWLMHDVPVTLLDGGDLPPRPQAQRRKLGRRLPAALGSGKVTGWRP